MLSYTVFNVEEAFRLVAHCPVRDQGCNHSSLGWAEGDRRVVELTMRRGRKIAKVAMARKLAVRLYWMMRKQWDYEQVKKFGSHAGQPGNRYGVKSNIE